MSVITRIARMKHPGVLRDFRWPHDLPDFGQYNLIYGWNGSGKTTISNIFRALELKRPPEGEVQVITRDGEVSERDVSKCELPVRVFNRDFVSESVFPVGGGNVPPIFVLGKESAEKQATVEKLKAEKSNSIEHREPTQNVYDQAETSLDKHCIDQARTIRESLRSSGPNSYNNYDKSRYKQHAERMLATNDKGLHLLADEERDSLLAQSRAIRKEEISKGDYRLPGLKQYQETASKLLQRTVVSSAIARLKDDPELASWVRQGLGLHQQRNSETCLFCEQSLPNERIPSLEAHFSAEYERLIQYLDEEISRIEAVWRSIRQMELPNRAEFYEDLASDYEKAQVAFTDNTKTIGRFLEDVAEALKGKKQNPFKEVPLGVVTPIFNSSAVETLNTVIQRHNAACDEFGQRVSEARERLEADSVASSLDEYQALQKAVKDSRSALADADVKIKSLGGQISELETDIIEYRQPANELNSELRSYLGHDELRLDTKDTGYAITRNGKSAKGLSEGERTAIALLYFLKSLKDRGFESDKGVVVLDDPVSSLDANALFLAFGFIKRRTDDVEQIFILTHNFSLFRQARNWFHHLKNQGKNDITKRPARFYMLECRATEDGRRSRLQALDPLLEKFESEYHYLFARVYRRTLENDDDGLEANYIFPNMARRLLETFLAFRQPQCPGELRQKLERITFDETKKTRILRFLHTHSHADVIGEPEHDSTGLAEAKGVLTDLLTLIEQEDPGHYQAMVDLVKPPQAEDQTQ